MARQDGDHTPERRKGRTLSVSDPLVTAAVAAIAIEGFNIGDTTRWGNRLACDARRWAQGARFNCDRRITKREAESVWRQMTGARA